RQRHLARAADDGGPRADVLLRRRRPWLRGGRRAPRVARRRGVVGQLLRARDDAKARARRVHGRRPRRDRRLQQPGRGRPAARRACRVGVRLLLLGGPKFVGRALTDAALGRGHEVTFFNRGTTRPDLYPEVEKLRGDRDGGLEALAGRDWDAAIDTSG